MPRTVARVARASADQLGLFRTAELARVARWGSPPARAGGGDLDGDYRPTRYGPHELVVVGVSPDWVIVTWVRNTHIAQHHWTDGAYPPEMFDWVVRGASGAGGVL